MSTPRTTASAAVASAALMLISACTATGPGTNDSSAPFIGPPLSTVSRIGAPNGDPVFVRPMVASSPNINIAIENEVHDYNNNTAKANNLANSRMTALVQPSVYLADSNLDLFLDGDVMSSVTQTSARPLTIVYRIKPEAVWSDGIPVSCDDFYLSWLQATSRATNNGGPAFDPAGTASYDQMNAPICSDGGKTVTTVYSTPFADWRSLFGPLVPAHVIERDSGVAVTALSATDTTGDVQKFAAAFIRDFAGFQSRFDLSAGPYRLQSLTSEQTVLVRNDRWWGNPAGPESLTLITNMNGESEVQALQNEEVQVISPQPDTGLAEQLRALPNVVFSAYAGATFEHLDFNLGEQRFQGGTGRALREAVFHCIDRTEIITKVVAGVDARTVPLGNLMYLPAEADYQDHYAAYHTADVAAAKSAMEAAGWQLGGDGVYALPDGSRAEFKVSHRSTASREKTAQIISSQCRKAGIKIDDDQDQDFNGERLPKGDFDTALFAWVGTPFKSGNFGIYTTPGPANYQRYSNPVVDQLFKQVGAEVDAQMRAGLSNRIDQAIAADFATLPLYQLSDMVAQTSKITPRLTYVGLFGGQLWNAFEWVYRP